jgi:hypothetical protein
MAKYIYLFSQWILYVDAQIMNNNAEDKYK